MVSRPGYSLNEGNDNNYCWLCKQHLEQHNTKYTMDPLGIRGRTAGCGKAACADALTVGIEDNYVCLCGRRFNKNLPQWVLYQVYSLVYCRH